MVVFTRPVVTVLAALALLLPAFALTVSPQGLGLAEAAGAAPAAQDAPPGQDQVTRARTPIAFVPAAVLGIDFSVKSPGGPHFDAAALTGVSWSLFTNGYIAQSFDDGENQVYLATIRAKGDPLGGIGPHMVFIVDGVPIAAWEVPPEYRTFQVAFRFGSNHPHSVAIAFTNDDIVPNPTGGPHLDDRNLIVDWVSVTPLPAGVNIPPTVTVQPLPQVLPFAGIRTLPVVPVEIGPQVIVVPQPAPQQPTKVVQTTVVNVNQQQRQSIVNNIQNTIVNNIEVDVAPQQVQVEQQPTRIPGATEEEREQAVEQAGNLTVQTREGEQPLEEAAEVSDQGIQVQVTPAPALPPGQGGTPPGQDGTPPGQDGTPPGRDGAPPGQDGVPPGQQGDGPPGQEDDGPPVTNVTPPNETEEVNVTPPNVTNEANVTPPNVTNEANVTPPNVTEPPAPPAPRFDLLNATVLACDNGTAQTAALQGGCLARTNVTPQEAAAALAAANATGGVVPNGTLNVTYALVSPENATFAAENKTNATTLSCQGAQCTIVEPFPIRQCPTCGLAAQLRVAPNGTVAVDRLLYGVVTVETTPVNGG